MARVQTQRLRLTLHQAALTGKWHICKGPLQNLTLCIVNLKFCGGIPSNHEHLTKYEHCKGKNTMLITCPLMSRTSDSLLSNLTLKQHPRVIISFSFLCSSSLQQRILYILVHTHCSVESLIHIYTTGCFLCLCTSLYNIHVCPKRILLSSLEQIVLVCNSKQLKYEIPCDQ